MSAEEIDKAIKPCRWFHKWLYLGVVKIVAPKLGPYDPRPDDERTEERRKSVCVDCGAKKIRPIDYPEIFKRSKLLGEGQ